MKKDNQKPLSEISKEDACKILGLDENDVTTFEGNKVYQGVKYTQFSYKRFTYFFADDGMKTSNSKRIIPENYISAAALGYYVPGISELLIKETMNEVLQRTIDAMLDPKIDMVFDLPQDVRNKSCPCFYLDKPCHGMCSCLHPTSSIACLNCCSVGNIKQKKDTAIYLNTIREKFEII